MRKKVNLRNMGSQYFECSDFICPKFANIENDVDHFIRLFIAAVDVVATVSVEAREKNQRKTNSMRASEIE